MATNNALGHSSIFKLLITLSIPAIVAQIVNVLYNMVDRIYIGNMESGSTAMAALSVSLPLITIITAFTRLLGSGGAPLCAIKMGEQDSEAAEKIMTNSFVMLIASSIVITVITLLFQEQFLTIFGADSTTLPLAKEYIGIYVIGTVFVQISLGMNSYITTQGFAKMSMITVLVGAILNIILDPIFIFGFNMGVKGAALATVIAQGCSALWVLRFLFGKRSIIKINRKYIKPDFKVVLSIMALGVSPFTMSATESLLQITFNNQLDIYGGVMAVASMSVLNSLWQFITLPLDGLMMGAQPILSYNYGAKNYSRVRKTFKISLAICLLVATLTTGTIMFFAPTFTRIFISDPNTIEFTAWALRIFVAGGALFGAQICCQQSFMALGQAGKSLSMALFRKVVVLIPLLYISPYLFGDSAIAESFGSSISQYVYDAGSVFSVIVSEPISDSLAAITTTCLFIHFYKKHLCKKDQNVEEKDIKE